MHRAWPFSASVTSRAGALGAVAPSSSIVVQIIEMRDNEAIGNSFVKYGYSGRRYAMVRPRIVGTVVLNAAVIIRPGRAQILPGGVFVPVIERATRQAMRGQCSGVPARKIDPRCRRRRCADESVLAVLAYDNGRHCSTYRVGAPGLIAALQPSRRAPAHRSPQELNTICRYQ